MSNEYGTLGSDPVSEASPIGADIRYETDFEWLEEEIGKMSKPVLKQAGDSDSGASDGARFVYIPVDWDEVVTVGSRVLREQSKDIRVAVWYAMGLAETKGFAGAAEGTAVCTQILQTYWDAFYPQRDVIRIASVRQLFDYMNDRLKGKEPAVPFKLTAIDVPHLEAASKFSEEVDTILREKLPDAPPMVGVFQSLLDDKVSGLKAKAAPPPSPAPDPVLPPSPAPNPDPSGRVEPVATAPVQPAPAAPAKPREYDFSKPGDRFNYFSSLYISSRALHEYGLSKTPRDPLAYRWIRMVHWSPAEYTQEITTVPLAGPNAVLVSHLKSLADNRQWETLLTAAESQFPEHWFWLDLQMYVHDALDNLGMAYHAARDAVRLETVFFLRRMPFFPNLKSQDGTPTACDETRDWLTDLDSDAPHNAAVAAVPALDLSGDPDKVQFNINHGDSIDKVLSSAGEYLATCRGIRDRFVAQLKLSSYLTGKKETELAYTYLTGLESSVTKFGLEQWEPDLAVAVLSELYLCLQKLTKTRKENKESLQQKLREVVTKIVAIDPVKAAEIVRK